MCFSSERKQPFLHKSTLITALLIVLGLCLAYSVFFAQNTSPTEKKQDITKINKLQNPMLDHQEAPENTESPEQYGRNKNQEEDSPFFEEQPRKENSDLEQILKELPQPERKIQPRPGIPIPERKELR